MYPAKQDEFIPQLLNHFWVRKQFWILVFCIDEVSLLPHPPSLSLSPPPPLPPLPPSLPPSFFLPLSLPLHLRSLSLSLLYQHTTIVIPVLLEVLLVFHRYPNNSCAVAVIFSFCTLYSLWYVYNEIPLYTLNIYRIRFWGVIWPGPPPSLNQ